MPSATAPRHDFAAVAAALRQEYDLLNSSLGALRPERWLGPSMSAEWPVQKVVSHLGSGAEITQRTLQENLDQAAPLTPEARQAIWDHFDSLAPAPLYEAFRDRNDAHLGYLEGLQGERRQAGVRFFAGTAPVGEFSQFRLSELALHSWDIRAALDPTARLLPGTARTLLPHGLETLTRRAKAPVRTELAGTVYGFTVSGPRRESFALRVEPDTITVDEGVAARAEASLELPTEAFIRLYAGRLPLEAAEADGEVVIQGDRAAALRLNALFAGF